MRSVALPRSSAARVSLRHAVRCASSSAPRNAPDVDAQTSATHDGAPPPFVTASTRILAQMAPAEILKERALGRAGTLTQAKDEGRSLTKKERHGTRLERLQARVQQIEQDEQMVARLCEMLDLPSDAQSNVLVDPAWVTWALRSEYTAAVKNAEGVAGSTNQKDPATIFRQARTRLWTPYNVSEEQLNERIAAYSRRLSKRLNLLKDVASRETVTADAEMSAFVEQQIDMLTLRLQAWQLTHREEQLDLVLQSDWAEMSGQQQRNNILRARYECLRRLGWRKGYSNGYPLSFDADEELEKNRDKMLSLLREGKPAERREALRILKYQEDIMAKQAWASMSEPARRLEEKAAWAARDRSLVYIDDTATSNVLGARSARWFDTPQRAGEVTYLPNRTIMLVANATPKNRPYDAFKATFRVPLDMHKHSVRSYLLAIYGLRTTWARSMIYRQPLHRDSSRRVKQNARKSTQYDLRKGSYKKVEVGLLEPFIFPDISEYIAQKYFRANDQKVALQQFDYKRGPFKINRWQTRVPLQPDEQRFGSIDNRPVEAEDELEGEETDRQDKPKRSMLVERGAKTSPLDGTRTSFWTVGKRTTGHGAILKVLSEKRLIKETAIKERAQGLQAESESR